MQFPRTVSRAVRADERPTDRPWDPMPAPPLGCAQTAGADEIVRGIAVIADSAFRVPLAYTLCGFTVF